MLSQSRVEWMSQFCSSSFCLAVINRFGGVFSCAFIRIYSVCCELLRAGVCVRATASYQMAQSEFALAASCVTPAAAAAPGGQRSELPKIMS